MKCILCKMCEAAKIAIKKKADAWLEAQMNTYEIWDRETDHEGIKYAHSLMKSDPAQFLKEYLTLAERRVDLGNRQPWGGLRDWREPADLAQAESSIATYEVFLTEAVIQLRALYVRSKQYAKAEQEVYRRVPKGIGRLRCIA